MVFEIVKLTGGALVGTVCASTTNKIFKILGVNQGIGGKIGCAITDGIVWVMTAGSTIRLIKYTKDLIDRLQEREEEEEEEEDDINIYVDNAVGKWAEVIKSQLYEAFNNNMNKGLDDYFTGSEDLGI